MPASLFVQTRAQVGQAVAGRVLTVDAGARRMTLTLKPGLLTSKLPLIAAPQHAVPGAKAHGVVTGVKVRFCVRMRCVCVRVRACGCVCAAHRHLR